MVPGGIPCSSQTHTKFSRKMNYVQERETLTALNDGDDEDIRLDSDDDSDQSTHDGENDQDTNGNNGSTEEKSEWMSDSDILQQMMTEHAVRSKHNTGVKGVLADYREYEQQKAMEREWKNEMARQEAKRNAFTCLSVHEEEALRERMANREEHKEEHDRKQLNTKNNEDADDEEFLRKYRMQKLLEMRKSYQPVYGSLTPVGSEGYLREIETAGANTFVVIHLKEDFIPGCKKMDLCLLKLARRENTVRFLTAYATKLNQNWDIVVLPSLLVYKNGDLVHSFIHVESDLGQEFDSYDVQKLLAKEGICSLPDPMVALKGDGPL